jgi:16S rRNA (uracil1498-N3)-methyltransferase
MFRSYYVPLSHLGGPLFFFSPLKHEALLFLLEKATELGVDILQPVLCDRTVVRQFSVEKALKRVIEAAEQSERLTIPRVLPLKFLKEAINQLEAPHTLWGAVERSEDGITPQNSSFGAAPVFLVGPEGGFTQEEKKYFKTLPFFRSLTLGDSILRAENGLHSLFCHFTTSQKFLRKMQTRG